MRQGPDQVLSSVQDRGPLSVPGTAHAMLASSKGAYQFHGGSASSQTWIRHSNCAYAHAFGTLPASREFWNLFDRFPKLKGNLLVTHVKGMGTVLWLKSRTGFQS